MDAGDLIQRAWRIAWGRKFTIALGALVVLGSAGLFRQLVRSFDNLRYFQDMPTLSNDLRGLLVLDPGVFLILAAFFLLLTLPLWGIGNIARGALVTAASQPDATFRSAWSEAWQKGWRLTGIGLISGLPGLIALLISGIYSILNTYYATTLNDLMASAYSGSYSVKGMEDLFGFNLILVLLVLCVVCPLTLITGGMTLLQTLADRATMLEDARFFAAYRRGWQVCRTNLRPALLLILLELVMWVILNTLLLIPEAIVSLCCLLWPVMWMLWGLSQSFFSALWTLAWQDWTSA
jgi:hypothetical protein